MDSLDHDIHEADRKASAAHRRLDSSDAYAKETRGMVEQLSRSSETRDHDHTSRLYRVEGEIEKMHESRRWSPSKISLAVMVVGAVASGLLFAFYTRHEAAELQAQSKATDAALGEHIRLQEHVNSRVVDRLDSLMEQSQVQGENMAKLGERWGLTMERVDRLRGEGEAREPRR